MTVPLTHRVESGWTYWLTTESEGRVRIDWSGAALQVNLPAAAATFPAGNGWVRVLDDEVVVRAGSPLTLAVEDADGNTQQWVSGIVQDLSRSSKERLPTSVWGLA